MREPVTGIMNCVGQLGAFFMAIVFGKIVNLTHSYVTPIIVLSGVLFVGCLLWLFVDPGKPLALAMRKEHSMSAEQVEL